MDSVFVNFGGEELELRSISAREYISALMETEILAEEMGDNLLAKSMILGASLLSKGLYYDENFLFPSIDEVLDAMSAEEIVRAAEHIDIAPEMKTKIIEAMDRVESVNDERGIYKNESVDSDIHSVPSGGEVSQKHDRSFITVYPETQIRSGGSYSESSISPRSDMRRVSDFFQRDSRRYDGIIVGY